MSNPVIVGIVLLCNYVGNLSVQKPVCNMEHISGQFMGGLTALMRNFFMFVRFADESPGSINMVRSLAGPKAHRNHDISAI
jgi:hypothetical protein